MTIDRQLVLTRETTAKRVPVDTVRQKQPKMTIATDLGFRVVVPFAPSESTAGNLAGQWVQTERPGLPPLLEWAGKSLPTIDLTMAVGWPDNRPITQTLDELRRIASSPTVCTVTGWHGLADGRWRMTELSIATSRLKAGTNEITQASVTIKFTAIPDIVLTTSKIGPGVAVNKTTTTISTEDVSPKTKPIYGPPAPDGTKPRRGAPFPPAPAGTTKRAPTGAGTPTTPLEKAAAEARSEIKFDLDASTSTILLRKIAKKYGVDWKALKDELERTDPKAKSSSPDVRKSGGSSW